MFDLRNKKIRISSIKEIAIFSIILILAISLRIWVMLRWPISADEAFWANQAREIIKNQRPFYEISIPYIGPIISYILIPSIYLFGNNIVLLRIPIVIISILSIIVVYLFSRKYYNRNVALVSALILSVIPNDFVNSSQTVEGPIIELLTVLVLYLLTKYKENGKNSYLFFLGLINGIGVLTSFAYLFFLVPFVLTLTIFPKKSFRKFQARSWIVISLAFILGFSPMIYWNLLNNFYSISFIFQNFPTTLSGTNLLDVKTNLFRGYSDFLNDFNKINREMYEIDAGTRSFSILFLIFLLLFIIIPIRQLSSKNTEILRKNFYLFIIFFILLILKSMITISEFNLEDLVVLYPLSSIIVSWSFVLIISNLKKYQFVIIILFLLFISYTVTLSLEKINEKITEINKDSCVKIIPEFSKYQNSTKISNVIVSTSHSFRIFKFYFPDITSNYLVGIYQALENYDKYYPKIWEENNQTFVGDNTTYVFINEKCDCCWSKNLPIYKTFSDFLAEYNKTLKLEKTFYYDNATNESLFQVFSLNVK